MRENVKRRHALTAAASLCYHIRRMETEDKGEGTKMIQEILRRAYEAIGDATPMTTDCGALCAAACCSTDADGQGGVCLLPGEEIASAWGEIQHDAQMDAPMLMCSGMCQRAARPFLCRIFPLCPVIGKNGKWTVRMDARARAVCPLAASGLSGLNPDFVRGCARAVQILAEDAQGEAFLARWSAIEAEFRRPLW